MQNVVCRGRETWEQKAGVSQDLGWQFKSLAWASACGGAP